MEKSNAKQWKNQTQNNRNINEKNNGNIKRKPIEKTNATQYKVNTEKPSFILIISQGYFSEIFQKYFRVRQQRQ